MSKIHLLQLSGGLSSWQAGERLVSKYGVENVRAVFCDTIIEDNDLYRFLIQGAASIFRVQSRIAGLAESASSLPLAEHGPESLSERKRLLAAMREKAMQLIPSLTWIADGRTPFEVFHDERFLGNSRIDPCSKILKRELADRWRKTFYTPQTATIAFGLNYDEEDRIEGIENRLGAEGWELEFPLRDYPHLGRSGLMLAAIDADIEPPALYFRGFRNNNCGGGCCKMGQKSAKRLLESMPHRFAMWEGIEAKFQADTNTQHTFLRDRRGGTPKPLSLKVLRERVQGGGTIDETDIGACSCFAEPLEVA